MSEKVKSLSIPEKTNNTAKAPDPIKFIRHHNSAAPRSGSTKNLKFESAHKASTAQTIAAGESAQWPSHHAIHSEWDSDLDIFQLSNISDENPRERP